MKYWRLGDLLITSGVITEEQLGIALQKQKEPANEGKRLGTVLIESGIITEEQLIETLQMQLGIDFIDLT
jgi:type IV pilus assembly protein PilB